MLAEVDKYKELRYEIYPWKVFLTVIAATSGILGIILGIKLFSGVNVLLAITAFLLMLACVYLVVFWLRIHRAIKDYSILLKDFKKIENNRDTLVLMYEKQGEENKVFERELRKEQSRVFVLAKLLPSKGNPEIQNLKQALGISYEEVDENE